MQSAHSKGTWSTWTWNYKRKKTVCRRCQQPGHIARDCTTDIQALTRSDRPAASGEHTDSGEVAGTQAPPAKQQRRTTKKSLQALARSDQPATSGEGTGSGEVADTQAPPAKRQRRTTKKPDYSISLSFSVNSVVEQDFVTSDR